MVPSAGEAGHCGAATAGKAAQGRAPGTALCFRPEGQGLQHLCRYAEPYDGQMKEQSGRVAHQKAAEQAVPANAMCGPAPHIGVVPLAQKRGEGATPLRGVYRIRCLRMPPDRHPERRGSGGRGQYWSWVHLTRDDHADQTMFQARARMSIGSRKYKARRAPQTPPF